MNTFIGLVAYVLIGGLVASLFINHHFKDCNTMPSESSIALAVFGWPIVFPIGLLLSDGVGEHVSKLNQCKEPK